MSGERSAEILNELQARGDREKLMQFVWSLVVLSSNAACFLLY